MSRNDDANIGNDVISAKYCPNWASTADFSLLAFRFDVSHQNKIKKLTSSKSSISITSSAIAKILFTWSLKFFFSTTYSLAVAISTSTTEHQSQTLKQNINRIKNKKYIQRVHDNLWLLLSHQLKKDMVYSNPVDHSTSSRKRLSKLLEESHRVTWYWDKRPPNEILYLYRPWLYDVTIQQPFFFFFVLISSPRGLGPIIDLIHVVYVSTNAPLPYSNLQRLPEASWKARPERSLPPEPNLSPVVYGYTPFLVMVLMA